MGAESYTLNGGPIEWPEDGEAQMGLPPFTLTVLGVMKHEAERDRRDWRPAKTWATACAYQTVYQLQATEVIERALDVLVEAGMVDTWTTVEAYEPVKLYRLKGDA